MAGIEEVVMKLCWLLWLSVLVGPVLGWGQHPAEPCVETMPGMVMCPKVDAAMKPAKAAMSVGAMELMRNMKPQTFVQEILHHASAGTSAEPDVVPVPMLMKMKREWMLMLHGNAFVMEEQQTGPRGGDKLFSTSWVMGMAEREWGPGQLTLRGMFSLEP